MKHKPMGKSKRPKYPKIKAKTLKKHLRLMRKEFCVDDFLQAMNKKRPFKKYPEQVARNYLTQAKKLALIEKMPENCFYRKSDSIK